MSLIISKFGIIPSAKEWSMPAGLSHEWPLATNGNDIIGTAHLTPNNISYSGGWAVFNGSNASFTIPSAGVATVNSDWSEEIWINADIIQTTDIVVSVGNISAGMQRGSGLNVTDIFFTYKGVDTANHAIYSSFAPLSGTDYQIIVTHEHGVETKLYINGGLEDADSYTGNELGQFNLGYYIGAQSGNVSLFDGKMRTRRLWQGTVLTPAQISGLWNSGIGR